MKATVKGVPLPKEKQLDLMLQFAQSILSNNIEMVSVVFYPDGSINMELKQNESNTST